MDTGWFKEHTECLSKGTFWLDERYPVELGEPTCHTSETGYVANPINKRRIKSYDNANPGAEMALGVSLDIREMSSGVSSDSIILRPDLYYPREITTMFIGICPVRNTSTGYTTEINDTVVPTNGGCVSLGSATGAAFTLGKAVSRALPTRPGLVWVNPQSFEAYNS